MHLERINNLLHELLFFKWVNTDVKRNRTIPSKSFWTDHGAHAVTAAKRTISEFPLAPFFSPAGISTGPDENILHTALVSVISYSKQELFRSPLPLNKWPAQAKCSSSPSSWLLKNGPHIPLRGADAFPHMGRPAVPQPAAATSASSSLFPAFQGFSSYSSVSPSPPSLSCVLKYPCTALAHGQGPPAWAKSG